MFSYFPMQLELFCLETAQLFLKEEASNKTGGKKNNHHPSTWLDYCVTVSGICLPCSVTTNNLSLMDIIENKKRLMEERITDKRTKVLLVRGT